MTRPTWATIVGVLGIAFGALGMMNAGQTAILPQMLEWQRGFMHEMTSSIPSQPNGPKGEDVAKALDSIFGPVPGWFKPWSLAVGLIGLLNAVAYTYAMISLLLMKRFAVRLIYLCSGLGILLAVARGVAGIRALSFFGLNLMMSSAVSVAFHCVLLLVIAVNVKDTFRDGGGATAASAP